MTRTHFRYVYTFEIRGGRGGELNNEKRICFEAFSPIQCIYSLGVTVVNTEHCTKVLLSKAFRSLRFLNIFNRCSPEERHVDLKVVF